MSERLRPPRQAAMTATHPRAPPQLTCTGTCDVAGAGTRARVCTQLAYAEQSTPGPCLTGGRRQEQNRDRRDHASAHGPVACGPSQPAGLLHPPRVSAGRRLMHHQLRFPQGDTEAQKGDMTCLGLEPRPAGARSPPPPLASPALPGARPPAPSPHFCFSASFLCSKVSVRRALPGMPGRRLPSVSVGPAGDVPSLCSVGTERGGDARR